MHAAVRGVIGVAPDSPEHVSILDTEASTEHLLVATARHAHAMFCVVEPYFTSLETGRRINHLAKDLGIDRVALIVNKVRSEEDLEAVEAFAEQEGLHVVGTVPYDDCFHEAERAEKAPIDYDRDAEAMKAIGQLAPKLLGANGAA
jgi:CO dehydrogenase maturation factor